MGKQEESRGSGEEAPASGPGGGVSPSLNAERRRWRRLVDLLASLLVLAIFAGLTIGVIMYFRSVLHHEPPRKAARPAPSPAPVAGSPAPAAPAGSFRPVAGTAPPPAGVPEEPAAVTGAPAGSTTGSDAATRQGEGAPAATAGTGSAAASEPTEEPTGRDCPAEAENRSSENGTP